PPAATTRARGQAQPGERGEAHLVTSFSWRGGQQPPPASIASRVVAAQGELQIANCKLQIEKLNLQFTIYNLQLSHGHRHHDMQIAIGADRLEDAGILRSLSLDGDLRRLDRVERLAKVAYIQRELAALAVDHAVDHALV